MKINFKVIAFIGTILDYSQIQTNNFISILD